jgi:hypothetical protein
LKRLDCCEILDIAKSGDYRLVDLVQLEYLVVGAVADTIPQIKKPASNVPFIQTLMEWLVKLKSVLPIYMSLNIAFRGLGTVLPQIFSLLPGPAVWGDASQYVPTVLEQGFLPNFSIAGVISTPLVRLLSPTRPGNEDWLRVAETLLQRGADPFRWFINEDGIMSTLFCSPIRTREKAAFVFNDLLNRIPDADARAALTVNSQGHNPFHHFAKINGYLDVANVLQQVDAIDINARAWFGEEHTPLSLACSINGADLKISKLISCGADPNKPSGTRLQPFRLCISGGAVQDVAAFLAPGKYEMTEESLNFFFDDHYHDLITSAGKVTICISHGFRPWWKYRGKTCFEWFTAPMIIHPSGPGTNSCELLESMLQLCFKERPQMIPLLAETLCAMAREVGLHIYNPIKYHQSCREIIEYITIWMFRLNEGDDTSGRLFSKIATPNALRNLIYGLLAAEAHGLSPTDEVDTIFRGLSNDRHAFLLDLAGVKSVNQEIITDAPGAPVTLLEIAAAGQRVDFFEKILSHGITDGATSEETWTRFAHVVSKLAMPSFGSFMMVEHILPKIATAQVSKLSAGDIRGIYLRVDATPHSRLAEKFFEGPSMLGEDVRTTDLYLVGVTSKSAYIDGPSAKIASLLSKALNDLEGFVLFGTLIGMVRSGSIASVARARDQISGRVLSHDFLLACLNTDLPTPDEECGRQLWTLVQHLDSEYISQHGSDMIEMIISISKIRDYDSFQRVEAHLVDRRSKLE